MNKNALLKIAAVLIALAAGFFQEQVKININYQLERGATIPGFFNMNAGERLQAVKEDRDLLAFDYYYNHGRLPWLYQFSQPNLVRLKWIFTLVFVLVFFFVNRWVLLLFCKGRLYHGLLTWTYTVAFALALLIYAVGRFAGSAEQTYTLSRHIVGALQSVVPAVLMYIHFLFERITK